MTRRKNILTILLSLFLSMMLLGVGSLFIKPSAKAATVDNPLRYTGSGDTLNTYYRTHWANGQDSRAYGETSGRWSFGYGDVANGTTLTYTKNQNFNAGNIGYQNSDNYPFAYFWGQTLTTMTYSTLQKQSMFVWEAEAPGDVHITGFLSKATSDKEVLLGTQNNVTGGSVEIPFAWNDAQYNWGEGDSYTITMWRIGADGTGGSIWSETYTSEYAKLINEKINVNTGDKIVIGLKGNTIVNNGRGDWESETLAMVSSQFTAGEYKKPLAKLTPAYVFGNNMVLQRGKPANIYGYGEPNHEFTITFADQTKTTTSDANGFWKVSLDAMEASSEGREMTITDGQTTITYTGVLVGEVWYCSGQSNMQYTLGQLLIDRGYASSSVWGGQVDYSTSPIKDYLNHTNYNKIRIYNQDYCSSTVIETLGAGSPYNDESWATPSSLSDVLGYSAYATGFALELQKGLDIPVGIVVSAIGGTSVEEWLSQAIIDSENLSLHYQFSGGKTKCLLYNGMTAPLNDYTVGGFLWYQGCADAGNTNETITKQWVAEWSAGVTALAKQFRASHGNVPFISQSLAQCCDWVEWRFIRQANYDLMSTIDNFYAVNGINYGMPYDTLVTTTLDNYIHPADKYGNSRDAGHIALTNVYGKTGYNDIAEYPIAAYKSGTNTYIEFEADVTLKLDSGTTVNNLQGYNGSSWVTISNATVTDNYILIPSTAYTKFRYAPYNVMMENSTNQTNWNNAQGVNHTKIHGEYNSTKRINLFSTRTNLPDLAVFAVLEMAIEADTGKTPAKQSFSATLTADETKGTITGYATGSYFDETALTITITPKAGYTIKTVKWNGADETVTASGMTLNKTVTGETTLEVTYEQITFAATLDFDETQGLIEIQGVDLTAIPYGSQIVIKVTPLAGYKVATVEVNGNGYAVTPEITTVTIDSLTENLTVVATFTEKVYNATVNNDNAKGTVTGITAGEVLSEGDSLDITVTALEGYNIVSIYWNGTAVEVTNAKTMSFTKAVDSVGASLTVVYEEDITYYTLTLENDDTKGSVLNFVNGNNIEAGTVLPITISAKTGYVIESVTWNGVNETITDNKTVTLNKTITEDVTLAITYTAETGGDTGSGSGSNEETKYQVTLTFDKEQGKVSGIKEQKYTAGSKQTVRVTPLDGYAIKSITINGEEIEITDTEKMTVKVTIDQNTTIEVEFESAGGGCGSSIAGMSVLGAVSMLGAGAMLTIKKRKED
ncbi:MAG: hypothetical protein IJY57_05145 [Clostridia bacterium]|nr:hypothetical protein [Clostridia bacterium]